LKTYLQSIIYKNTNIDILRLDLLHPDIQGNKYYKLKYNLEEAKAQKKNILLSFGGEYSNHIHALSLAGKVNNYKTIGIIRGDKPEKLNNTLSEAAKNGMQLFFTSRTNFRVLRKLVNENELEECEALLKTIVSDFDLKTHYLIPEGGTNTFALKGTQEILSTVDVEYNHICVSIGTAGTIAGIIASSPKYSKIIGFPSLKGDFFENDIKLLLVKISNQEYNNWSLQNNYHFGGFGAYIDSLVSFMNSFYDTYKIPLDTVYTGKMFFGIFDLIDKGFFNEKDNILAIHTGGLQGIKGFNEKNGNLIHY